jgi:hypothetical protein
MMSLSNNPPCRANDRIGEYGLQRSTRASISITSSPPPKDRLAGAVSAALHSGAGQHGQLFSVPQPFHVANTDAAPYLRITR